MTPLSARTITRPPQQAGPMTAPEKVLREQARDAWQRYRQLHNSGAPMRVVGSAFRLAERLDLDVAEYRQRFFHTIHHRSTPREDVQPDQPVRLRHLPIPLV